ncbi:MAG: 2-phospho-L-lactate guanylyltransferase [Marmoricola sp.]|jgi:2-phospho-L-lactate guanylyltransferase|nr:2-phospho-L-lactate guanylyltransferase [Marmoricola sp.]
MPPEVVACIPAKALSHAKSRLGLADAERRLVAKRLLHTTARTALGSDWVRSVLVVTADLELADIATAAGARVVPETAPGGLNAAVDLVRQAARFASPHGWVLTLVADLPYLTSAELDVLVVEALTAKRPVMVPDAQGVGTTCLLHPSDRPGPALFGPGSAHRHREAGYIPAGLSLVGLREDLDAAEDVMRLPERTRDALLTAEKSPDAERCRSVGGLALS